MMRERQEEVVIPNMVEVLDNLDDDLDRMELWTAALSCFQHRAPEYQPNNIMSDAREGTARSMLNKAKDRTAHVAEPLKSATEDLYGQTGDASQVLLCSHSLSPEQRRAAGRIMKVARSTASSFGDVVRNTIENQPYTAVAIALGLGWLLGRMHRSL
jgi:glycerate kinase